MKNKNKSTEILFIIGLLLATFPSLLRSQEFSDLKKGLFIGVGIGLLFLSLIYHYQFHKAKK